MSKTEERLKVFEELKSSYIENQRKGWGIVATGAGKTKMMIDIIKEHISRFQFNSSVLIVVNSTNLRDVSFLKEVEKFWDIDEFHSYCKITTYQTAYKWIDTHFSLGLFDELDFGLTEEYVKTFTNNKYDEYLGLSGTCSKSKRELAESTFGKKLIDYDIHEAQNNGLVNKTKIYLHEVPLYTKKNIQKGNNLWSESDYYIWLNKKIDSVKTSISNSFEQLNEEIDSTMRDIIKSRIEQLKKDKSYLEYGYNNQFNRTITTYSLDSVTDYVLELKKRIFNKNKDSKLLLFAMRNKDIDKISKYSYTGTTKDDSVLTKFDTGEIRELGVIKRINRGISFENLNHCIVHSFSSSDTEFLQGAIGRMVRLPVNETAYIHIIVSYYYNKGVKTYCQNKVWFDNIISSTNFEYETINLYESRN